MRSTWIMLAMMTGCTTSTAAPDDDVCCDSGVKDSVGSIDATSADSDSTTPDSALNDTYADYDASGDALLSPDGGSDAATVDAVDPPDAATVDAVDPPDADPPDADPPDAVPLPDAQAAAWGQPPPTNFDIIWEYTGSCPGDPISANGCFDFRAYTSMTVSDSGDDWEMRFTNGTAYQDKFFYATIGTFGDEMYLWDIDEAYLRPFNNSGCPWVPSTVRFAAHVAEQTSGTQLVGESTQMGWTTCYASGSPPGCYHAWRYTATVVP